MNVDALSVIVRHAPVDDPAGSSTGGARAVVTSALLYGGVVTAGLLVAAPLAARRLQLGRLLPAAGILAAATVVAARGEPVGEYALTAVHLVAVTLWVGAVLHLAIATLRGGWDEVRRRAAALAPYAVGSAAVVAGTGTALVLAHHLSARELLTTTFGAVIVVKVAALLAAALLGVGHRRTGSPRERNSFVRAEAGTLGAALAMGSALLGVTPPAPAVVAIAPGLVRISFTTTAPVPVFLREDSGSGRLTLLGDETVQVVDRIAGRSFQLTPGATAVVALTGRRAHLSITSGAQTSRVTLEGARVPVPASPLLATVYDRDRFALGRTLGVLSITGRPPVPICLPDAKSLAAVTTQFVRRRAHQRAELISTDAASAQQQLRALASSSSPPPGGVYLAANLLDGALLASASRLRLPPLAVVGVGDPMSPLADRFRALLQQVGAGTTPSAAALLGYESVVAPDVERTVGLFVAEPVGFLPGLLDVGHNHTVGSWMPGGTIVAATRSVTVPLVCSTEEST